MDFGVWALVFNVVAPVILNIPLYFTSTPFVPKFRWSNQAFKDIFGFGIFTTGSSLMIKITNQFDYLLVGKLLGKTPLGIYTFAFIITEVLRGQIVNIFTKVMYPVFSKEQDDNSKLKFYYYELLKIISLFIIPAMLFLIFFTTILINYMFGHKWDESIPIIKIFSWAVILQMPLVSITALIRGSGKPKTELYFQLVKSFIFYIPLIYLGTYYYGIIGTAYGHLIFKILTLILGVYLLNKLFDIRITEIFKAMRVSIIIGFLPFVILYFFTDLLDKRILLVIYLIILFLSYYIFGKKDFLKYKNLMLMYLKKK